jgi:hypothetical protein
MCDDDRRARKNHIDVSEPVHALAMIAIRAGMHRTLALAALASLIPMTSLLAMPVWAGRSLRPSTVWAPLMRCRCLFFSPLI